MGRDAGAGGEVRRRHCRTATKGLKTLNRERSIGVQCVSQSQLDGSKSAVLSVPVYTKDIH